MNFDVQVRSRTTGITGVPHVTNDRSGLDLACGAVAGEMGAEDLRSVRRL